MKPDLKILGTPRGQIIRTLTIISSITLVIDQLTKWWALETLAVSHIDSPELIEFSLTTNQGVAFSIGAGSKAIALVVGISFALLTLLLRLEWATASPRAQFASGLLVGGALGNIVDRVGRGAVIDFIHLRYFSIFNVADIAIVLGAALLIFVLLTSEITRVKKVAKT